MERSIGALCIKVFSNNGVVRDAVAYLSSTSGTQPLRAATTHSSRVCELWRLFASHCARSWLRPRRVHGTQRAHQRQQAYAHTHPGAGPRGQPCIEPTDHLAVQLPQPMADRHVRSVLATDERRYRGLQVLSDPHCIWPDCDMPAAGCDAQDLRDLRRCDPVDDSPVDLGRLLQVQEVPRTCDDFHLRSGGQFILRARNPFDAERAVVVAMQVERRLLMV